MLCRLERYLFLFTMKNEWLRKIEFKRLLKTAQDKYKNDPDSLTELDYCILSQQPWSPRKRVMTESNKEVKVEVKVEVEVKTVEKKDDRLNIGGVPSWMKDIKCTNEGYGVAD